MTYAHAGEPRPHRDRLVIVDGYAGGMPRPGMLGLVCALGLAALTGCGPSTEGAIGVRLDAGGQLVGVLGWCGGGAGTDTIILYLGQEDGSVTDEVVRLDRDPGRGARNAEEVVLLDPADGWLARRTASTLDTGQIYDLRAWNTRGGAVRDFPFRISELTGRTGSDVILTKRWEGEDRGGYVATFRTPADFARYADTMCDG